MRGTVQKGRTKSPGIRDLAVVLLECAEEPGCRLDELIRAAETRSGLDARDRAFLREVVLGTVRWKGRLDWILERRLTGRADKLPKAVRNILRLGAYQILHTDRIPDWASVNEAVEQTRHRGFPGLSGLVNGVLRELVRHPDEEVERGQIADLEDLVRLESHPRWMVERWVERLGLEAALRVCRANNEVPPLSLRLNRRRCTEEILRGALEEAGVQVMASGLVPSVLRIRGGPPVRELPGYREGWFSVQDEGAALIAPLLQVRPGDRVWDACAGPGGKSLHLAELMEDEGFLLATDSHGQRLKRVADGVRRLGLRSVRPARLDALSGAVRKRAFDAVLVDAPCSGLGVIRRHPEGKWNKSEDDILRLSGLQIRLLQSAAGAVRPGGRMLYCVCSNEEEETVGAARGFERSKAGRDFERDDLSPGLPEWMRAKAFVGPEGSFSIRPGDAGTDGFFAVLWRRAS